MSCSALGKGSQGDAREDDEEFCVRILQINDVYELDNFPNLYTLIHEESKEKHIDLLLLSGDFLGPSLLSSLDEGASMVDCLNELGITHVCFGNHETDVRGGVQSILARIKQSRFQWINSNMVELDTIMDHALPRYEIVSCSNGRNRTKKIAICGFLTNDPSLYQQDAFGGATIEDVIPSARKLFSDILQEHPDVDLILPMTHQSMEADRQFAIEFGHLVPFVPGGHDHTVFDETINGCRILKTGHDANNAGVIDIIWHNNTTEGTPRPSVEVRLLPVHNYPQNERFLKRIEQHKLLFTELERARLFRIRNWLPRNTNHQFSTKNNRLGPTTGSTALVTLIRMGMQCQCAVVGAGSIRGNKTYDESNGFFTWKDLKTEIPFDTPITALRVPGKVLEKSIRYSRQASRQNPPVAKGGFLHTCNNINYNDVTQRIESISGEAFDPDKSYLTAMNQEIFIGIDNHVHFLEWSEASGIHPREDASTPAKLVIVKLFCTLIWLQLAPFHELDADGDGKINREDLKKAVHDIYGTDLADVMVDNIMSVADKDENDRISPLEMMVVYFVATDMKDHVGTEDEEPVLRETVCCVLGDKLTSSEIEIWVQRLRQEIDKNKDGTFNRLETAEAIGRLRRKSLLF